MEDGVTEIQSFLPPLNLNPEDGSNRGDESVSTEKPEEVKKEDLGEEEEEAEDKGKDSSSAKEETKGGLINNLISTLVSPMSPKIGNRATENENRNGVFKNSEKVDVANDVEDGEKGGGVVGNNSGEGGLISNLVSNFFHKNEREEEEEEEVVDEKIKRVKTEDEGNGGGSIIHNIVSHFPAQIPADAVPTADEASILINSLVRD